MGERETWKCPMPDDVCEQCGYRCSAPAPAEAVAWKDALAVIQRHIEQLEGKERTAQFLAVTVSLEKNASRTIGELHETMRSTVDTLKHVPTHPAPARGEAVTPEMVEYARYDADAALAAMSTNLHGTPNTMEFVEQCLRRIRAALARPDRERDK